jgi:hypothetical protein
VALGDELVTDRRVQRPVHVLQQQRPGIGVAESMDGQLRPRPNLRRAQPLVQAFCQHHDLPYTEASLVGSYAQALRHLHTVGAPLRPAGAAE